MDESNSLMYAYECLCEPTSLKFNQLYWMVASEWITHMKSYMRAKKNNSSTIPNYPPIMYVEITPGSRNSFVPWGIWSPCARTFGITNIEMTVPFAESNGKDNNFIIVTIAKIDLTGARSNVYEFVVNQLQSFALLKFQILKLFEQCISKEVANSIRYANDASNSRLLYTASEGAKEQCITNERDCILHILKECTTTRKASTPTKMFNQTYLMDSLKGALKVGQANNKLTQKEVQIDKTNVCFILDVRKQDGQWASGLKDVVIERPRNMLAQLAKVTIGEVKPVSSSQNTSESGTESHSKKSLTPAITEVGFQATFERLRETFKVQILDAIDTQFDKLTSDIPDDLIMIEKSVLQEESHLNDEEARLKEWDSRLHALGADIDAEFKAIDVQLNDIHRRENELTDKENMLKAQVTELEQQESHLQMLENQLLERKTMVLKMKKISDQKVTLNVGGQYFTTSKSTLCQHENSHLFDIISSNDCDGEKPIFIDRDGKAFGFVLKYLRHGKDVTSLLPNDNIELKELLIEAEYFKLKELTDIVKVKLK